MALNIFYGRDNVHDEKKKEVNYLKVQKFLGKFEKKFGSTNCRELTGCDLSTEQGLEKFNADNLDEKCRNFVEQATTTVMSLIETSTNK